MVVLCREMVTAAGDFFTCWLFILGILPSLGKSLLRDRVSSCDAGCLEKLMWTAALLLSLHVWRATLKEPNSCRGVRVFLLLGYHFLCE